MEGTTERSSKRETSVRRDARRTPQEFVHRGNELIRTREWHLRKQEPPFMQTRALRGLCLTDDPDTFRAFEAILRRCGFDVVSEVDSAAKVVAAAKICQPQAALLDVSLTGELGLGVVRALHRVAPTCAVVMVSPFEAMKSAAIEAGAFDFVGDSDLRLLEGCVERIASNAHLAHDTAAQATTPEREAHAGKRRRGEAIA